MNNGEVKKETAVVRRSFDGKGKVDSKEIGDQYLEENKRMSLKNKKRPPTPVNLKSIDYNPEVKQRLEKNEKTLSSVPLRSQEIKQNKRAFTVSQAVQSEAFIKSSYSDEKEVHD